METREDVYGFDGISGDGPIWTDTMLENLARISPEAIDFYNWAIWDSGQDHLFDAFSPEILRIYLGLSKILDRAHPNGFIRDFLVSRPEYQREWFNEVGKHAFGHHLPEYDMGYVYALLFENGLVKIGKTENLCRHQAFTVGAASPLREYYYFATSNRHIAEKEAHRHFEDCRAHGEFFRISYAEAIEYLSGMYKPSLHS